MLKEKKLSSKRAYERDWFKLDVDEVECESGIKSTREVVRHPGAAVILAIKDHQLIIEKQYRYAIGDFAYELPAGKLDLNENPVEGAIREFEEECGYKANNMYSLGFIYPAFGFSDEKLHLFYTDDFVKTNTRFDEDENIETIFMDLDEVLNMIDTNEISDAKTICSIYKYLRLLEKQ